MLRRGLFPGPKYMMHLRAAESACSSRVRCVGRRVETPGWSRLTSVTGLWSTFVEGVSCPDCTYELVAELMRCLTFGRVAESVWKSLMLNTMGTMSMSSQRRVHRLGLLRGGKE